MNQNTQLSPRQLKIELGAGTNPHKSKEDGWRHNDLRNLSGIDIVAPCNKLGLRANSVDAFYSSHMLEHIHWDQCRKTVSYWYELLSPGGYLEIVCPNAGYAMRKFLKLSKEKKSPPGMIYRVLWGTRDAGTEALPPNNVHHNGFTKNLLEMLLSSCGFKNVKVENKPRFGISDRDIHAIAYKKR